MPKFSKSSEIRSALLHLHSIVLQDDKGMEGTKTRAASISKAQEAIDQLAARLGEIYDVDLSDLEEGDSYGEIEWLRWALDGCCSMLSFETEEDMVKALRRA